MATNFPSSLDNFTNPTSGDTLDSPDHAAQHADVNDAVEALQAKVGVDGSAVTTSLEYRLNDKPRFRQQILYLSSGTFVKANYPWLKSVRVVVVGGGGGGGYCRATGTNQVSCGASGGAGAVGIFWLDADDLAATETVTVGTGGAGGSVAGVYGAYGGTTSFASVLAYGGGYGSPYGASTTGTYSWVGGAGSEVAPYNFSSSFIPEFIPSNMSWAYGMGETSACYNNVDVVYAGAGGCYPPYGPLVRGRITNSSTSGPSGGSYTVDYGLYGGGASARVNSDNRPAYNGFNGAGGCVHIFLYG